MTPDRCCWACKSPTGVCLSRYACQHHLDAQAQDEANHRARKLYNDPTAERAVSNAMRPNKRRAL